MNQSASLLWGDDGGHQMSVIPLSDTSGKPKRFPAVTASGLRRCARDAGSVEFTVTIAYGPKTEIMRPHDSNS